MASEDVIELGSSDDEAEPAPKKMKPVPNAMVHIPSKIHGVTIKPTKFKVNPIPKVLAGKNNVTVTKITKNNIVSNPYASSSNKTNGKVTKIPLVQSIPKSVYNPLNIAKKINSQVVISKINPATRVLKNPIKVHSPRSLNNLPPSITITKTKTSGNWKRPAVNMANPVRKKQKLNKVPKPTVGDVMTVELDDDDASPASSGGPQWYVRPEEQASAEEINNKEPEKPLYVEITIEDSPIKPPPNKRTYEVGAELCVTIDDSPVKNVPEKNTGSGSDVESKSETKDKHGKKKLEYPKESDSVGTTIEIEIPPCVDHMVGRSNAVVVDAVIEIEESPLKIQSQSSSTSTPKKDHPKARLETAVPLMALQDDELSDFHPVYGNFIKLCMELENSDDMKKIVEKKIKAYYRQVPKDYTESEEFIDMVSSKIVAMKAGPEKMYLFIKDIVDELNLQRKLAKSQVLANIEAKASGSDNFLYGENSEYDLKRQRQIRKLEKTLKKLHRAIQKLEEQEVDFDDDEDSVYLLTESDEDCTSNKDSDKQLEKDPKALLLRYKERMVRVHAKFCQLTNTKMPSEPRVQIDARPGQPQGPAKRLEKWVNKKVPIGTPLPFPDFHDVLRCVREANEEDDLGWNEADIMEEARDLFTRCGKKLQRRRQENEWRLAASRITVDADPAEKSDDLKRKLEENKKMATKKETEVFNKYADRQKQLKLEAEEIGDKEADESPIESEEDEPVDESSLHNNTEKRKERLKRLIQEKSKKVCEEEPLNKSNMEDKSKEVVNEKQSEEKSIDSTIDINKSKDKLESAEQEDKNEANKENQLSIVDGSKKDKKSDDTDKLDETDTTGNKKNQDTGEKETKMDDEETIHSLSDDSNKLESDVDELHLLQKLHSENEMYSTSEISCSDTPIAISDSLGSSEDNKKQVSDVISIENSSYSESEVNKNATDNNDIVEEVNIPIQVDEDLTQIDTEMECTSSGVVKKIVKTNNDEYNESIEDILLASSDDEAEVEKDRKPANEEGAVNLRDETLSIGDTLIEGAENSTEKNNLKKQEDTNSVESVTIVSVDEALTKVGQEDKQNNVTESRSAEKQEEFIFVDSLNAIIDTNKDIQVGENVAETHEVTDNINKDLIEEIEISVNIDTNKAEKPANVVNSAENEGKSTDVINEPAVSMDVEPAKEKVENDGSRKEKNDGSRKEGNDSSGKEKNDANGKEENDGNGKEENDGNGNRKEENDGNGVVL